MNRSREFKSCGRCVNACNPGQVVHTHASLSPTRVSFIPAQAGKVTPVGLASHRPCVTDNSGIFTYGLTTFEREIKAPRLHSFRVQHAFYFLPLGGYIADVVPVVNENCNSSSSRRAQTSAPRTLIPQISKNWPGVVKK